MPIAREAWQRLLGSPDDGPPETTDARIRAAARRALAPGGRRWLLPVSLAASFVLAVMVAQLQFGALRVPVEPEEADAARAAAPGDEAEEDAFGHQASALAEEAATSELPAADAPAAAAPPEARAESAMSNVGRLYRESLPHSATPEAWYAEIERLRAAGNDAEADRQLEHLKVVYPGWLERRAGNTKQDERR